MQLADLCLQALEGQPLPFFIEWQSKDEQPDQVAVEHNANPMVIYPSIVCPHRAS